MLNSRLELLFKYTCLYSNTLSIRIKGTGLLVWRRMDCYNTLQIKLQKIINNYTHFKTHFSCCTQSLLVRYHMFARDLIQIRCIKCLHLVDTCSNVSSVWWCGSCGLKQLRRLSIALALPPFLLISINDRQNTFRMLDVNSDHSFFQNDILCNVSINCMISSPSVHEKQQQSFVDSVDSKSCPLVMPSSHLVWKFELTE